MEDKEEKSSNNEVELNRIGEWALKHKNTLVNVVILVLLIVLLVILYIRIDLLTTNPCRLCEQYMNCISNSTVCLPKPMPTL